MAGAVETVRTYWLQVAACLGFAVTGAVSTGSAAADRVGRPAPYAGPPLIRGTPNSPWVSLAHKPPYAPGSMLLMADGSVLVHDDDTRLWERLVPGPHGSYARGRWSRVASLPPGYRPQYFTSAVLADGRVVVLGGEYDGGNNPVETNNGAVYDPAANTWKSVAAPAGWNAIGDAQSTVLGDGRLVMADLYGSDAAVLDPRTLTWTPTGMHKLDYNSEEGFSLLPDGRVLTVDTLKRGSELLDFATGTWSSAGTVPTQLVGPGIEQGPLVSGPDGTVFAVGATGHTALYHPAAGAAGRWSVGPDLPIIHGSQYVASDAAGARLPNGDVVFDASPPGQKAPTHVFLYHGHDITLLDDNATWRDGSSFNTRMLVLPTGEILFDDGATMYVFHASGKPRDAWRPSIDAVPRRLAAGVNYQLSGRQLAGRDQGGAYGDDFQDNTNYPLVRIRSLKSNAITYATTRHWSTFSTAPGTVSSTSFTLPRGIPRGPSRLVVVANGISSKPVPVTIVR